MRLNFMVNNMDVGESIYINAVNISTAEQCELAQLIKKKVLMPDWKELKRVFTGDAVVKALSGNIIAPQMSYVKLSD